MGSLSIFQVDAFTDRPFGGNPAAVCLTPEPLETELMQSVAMEMNLSETAFLVPQDRGDLRRCARYKLRWFTPLTEVDLCGHATLAAAKVLFERYGVESHRLEFETHTGVLKARRDEERIVLDFPGDRTFPIPPPEGLLEALGLSRALEVCKSMRMSKLLVLVDSPGKVHALQPDPALLADVEKVQGGHGVSVTARVETGEADFVSRFFAPSVGVEEDPVTGTAHTVLGPYWAARLQKPKLRAYQASARGGWLDVTLRGARVELAGQAVVVMEGKLLL